MAIILLLNTRQRFVENYRCLRVSSEQKTNKARIIPLVLCYAKANVTCSIGMARNR